MGNCISTKTEIVEGRLTTAALNSLEIQLGVPFENKVNWTSRDRTYDH